MNRSETLGKRTNSRSDSLKLPISIITVVRNDPDGLGRTLDSYLAQDRTGSEILVFDGNSNDGTMDVARSYGEAIDLLHSAQDGGIFDAMNRAVERATGDWILFMNAGDCFAAKDVLARVYPELKRTDAEILYGDVFLSFEAGTFLRRAGKPTDLWKGMICSHQSAIVRKDLLQRFPFDLNFALSADYRFFVESYCNGARFSYLEFPISIFSVGGISSQKFSSAFRETMKIRKEFALLTPRRRLYLLFYRGYTMLAGFIKSMLPLSVLRAVFAGKYKT
ncbi:MAG: glycosyltransferase [Leptospiraceae bacterium]|nr:glycosyltransferase [Leptospiraceae bacterium]